MSRDVVWSGTFFTIEVFELDDGSSPAADFLDSLDEGDRRGMDVLFDRLCGHGRITHPEKFKKIEDSEGIYEFKRHQIRLFCCMALNKRVYLLHGVRKKQDRHKPTDIQRAELYRKMLIMRGDVK